MARSKEKIEARKLRRQGESFAQIAKKLSVSKSSASLWCRDILLTDEQINQLRKQKGSVMGRWLGAESNRRKKREAIEKNKKEAFRLVKRISKRDLLIAGLCLFWGEGSKTGSRFIFINSDVDMLKIMKSFLVDVLEVSKNDIRATVQINHVHRPRIKSILNFWSKQLGLSLNCFSNPYYINVIPKKVYENHDRYNGILRLQVLRGSNLQYKMLGLIEAFNHYFKSM
ncbi:MAG: hypothetical protein WCW47_03820 [Candidatus Paceibacterota bacterium]|jgi:hypothetical protein